MELANLTLLPLLGQAEPPRGPDMSITLMLFVPVLVGLTVLLVIVLPLWLALRHDRRQREMEHAERMRAIELGQPFPTNPPWWSPARVAVAIGAGVPVAAFAIGWMAATTTGAGIEFIWPSAGAVGVAGIVCGTILAARLPNTEPARPAVDPHTKPPVDPDAYEMAGHGG